MRWTASGWTEMPLDQRLLEKVRPVYESLPGWKASTAGISKLEELPPVAMDYLRQIAKWTGVEVGAISTGPERSQTVLMPGSRLAQLLGL